MNITTSYAIHISFEEERIINHTAVSDLIDYLREERIPFNTERARIKEKVVEDIDGDELISYKFKRLHINHIGIYMRDERDSETERILKVLNALVAKCEYKVITKEEKEEIQANKAKSHKEEIDEVDALFQVKNEEDLPF